MHITFPGAGTSHKGAPGRAMSRRVEAFLDWRCGLEKSKFQSSARSKRENESGGLPGEKG